MKDDDTPKGPRVYFIQQGNAIKIGFSEHVERRFRALQTGHHGTLILLNSVSADRRFEQTVHEHFRHLHIRGEWFSVADDLLEFIKNPEVLSPPPPLEFVPPELIPEPIPEEESNSSFVDAANEFMQWSRRQKFRTGAEVYAATRVAFWLNMLRSGPTPERLAGLKESMARFELIAI